jgi:hypothetical protein
MLRESVRKGKIIIEKAQNKELIREINNFCLVFGFSKRCKNDFLDSNH